MTPAATPLATVPPTDRKRFALEEANQSLAYVRKVVDDITQQYGQIVALRRTMEDPATPPSPTDQDAALPIEHAEAAYETAMDRLGGLVDELHEAGVELRDFEHGVVAFPAEHDGRTILYSWQPGESDVCHYHEQDESITQRRGLAALSDTLSDAA